MSAPARRLDAIVVGAGPAGSAAALLLARAGRSVALLEKAAIPRDAVCGEFVSEEGVSVLRDLGVDTTRAATVSSARFFGASGEAFSSRRARGIGWSRGALDGALAEAAARAGAVLEDRTAVTAPIVERGIVRGVIATSLGDGEVREWRAPVVVAADGRRSTIARELWHRTPFRHPSPRTLFGFRTHLDEAALVGGPGPTVELFVHRGGYAGFCPIESGRVNLAFVLERWRLRREAIRDVLDENPVLRERLSRVPRLEPLQSVGPLELGRRPLTRAGVVFLGDAGGPIDPFMGEGISIALETARLAAPILCEACERGGLDRDLARRYREAYRERIARRMRVSMILGWVLARPAPLGIVLALARRRPSTFDAIVSTSRG